MAGVPKYTAPLFPLHDEAANTFIMPTFVQIHIQGNETAKDVTQGVVYRSVTRKGKWDAFLFSSPVGVARWRASQPRQRFPVGAVEFYVRGGLPDGVESLVHPAFKDHRHSSFPRHLAVMTTNEKTGKAVGVECVSSDTGKKTACGSAKAKTQHRHRRHKLRRSRSRRSRSRRRHKKSGHKSCGADQ